MISIGSLIRTSAAKDTIHIGVIIPVNSEIIDFSAYIPTLELALETIENDTTLPFNFAITFNDSMVCSHSNYTNIRHTVYQRKSYWPSSPPACRHGLVVMYSYR